MAAFRRGILAASMGRTAFPVSDDDLISLDFTLPGALDPLPPVESPSPPPPPPVVVDPPVAADPVVETPSPTDLVPALTEAAELHAAGDDLEAMRRLEQALKQGEAIGDDPRRVWRALFEVLQALGRRQAFDALALAYARHFELSPPTWNETGAVSHAAHATTGGHTHVCLSGMLDAQAGAVLKKALGLAQRGDMVRFDVAKVEAADEAGATLFLRALAALKKAGKEYLIANPRHLADILAARLETGRRENEPLWLLLLELYQQAFLQAEFEEAAINYAVTFERSPPSWVALPPQEVPPPAPLASRGFVLSGQLIGAGEDAFAALLTLKDNPLEIDAGPLARIDTVSAHSLNRVIGRLAAGGSHVVIRGLSVLNAVFLERHGLARHADLIERTN